MGSLFICLHCPNINSVVGRRGEASCHQDERAFLLPKSSLHCYGTAQHQSIRAHKGKWIRRIYNRPYSEVHKSDVVIAYPHAPPSHSSLWFEAWGALSILILPDYLTNFVLRTYFYDTQRRVVSRLSTLEVVVLSTRKVWFIWFDFFVLLKLLLVYTYIQSRFYRSPEVILGMNYHMAIDMWSLGCILAELYTGFPIFPGENEQEQLSCIMEVLGVPDKEFINRSSRRKLFFGTHSNEPW